MPSVTVPLGTKDINGLIAKLKNLSRQFRDETSGDGIKVLIEQSACHKVGNALQVEIERILDVDGNYLGTDNPNAAVTVEPALHGHETVWRGKQIAYVEFGTGMPGTTHPYPGPAMAANGYHPDPTKGVSSKNRKDDTSWAYVDAKLGVQVTYGLLPQAPMYKVAQMLHDKAFVVSVVRPIVGRALDAVAL